MDEWADLERRVSAIERHLGLQDQPLPDSGGLPHDLSHDLSRARETATPTALMPLLGRALLGLAGAYLLRTVGAPVSAGLLYAIAWLFWAARTPAEQRLETALHSLTAVLVLSPLLWEATLRFHSITTWSAGAILLFFTVFGLAVSWRKNLLIVATIATLAGLGTAAALLFATHDVLPFTFVLLAIGAAVEISACLNHWLSERWLTAAAADLAVLLATWLVTSPRGLPESYSPIPHPALLGAQVALLAIYLSSTIVRTLFRHLTMTWFETAQCVAAFAVIASGGLGPSIGVLALICGLACYAVAFALLDRDNFYTYSTFGIVLTLFATWVLFPGVAAPLWGVLAIGCVAAGGVFRRVTLEAHGAIYLLLAATFSGAAGQATASLLGSASWTGANGFSVAWCAAAAAVSYAASRHAGPLALRLALAVPACWLAAALAALALTALYHAAFGAEATHAYCATLRTSVLVCLVLLMAWAGGRWQRPELSHLVYPAMLLVGYRLLMEDLHQDRKAALFLSLLISGAALMVLPRFRPAGLHSEPRP